MRETSHEIEEIHKGIAEPRWDDGLELLRDDYGQGATFRLLLGGACVGILRVESGMPRILSEHLWVERLLREVHAEWHRCEVDPLPMAA